MHYSIIINPIAGGQQGARVWPQLKAQLTAAGVTFRARQTKEDGARDLARRIATTSAADPTAAIIIIGGDGTVREAVSGVLAAGLTIPIGIVPVGFQNQFAKAHRIASNPAVALAAIIAASQPTSLPIGRFHEAIKQERGCFLTSLEIGLGAAGARGRRRGQWPFRLIRLFSTLYNQTPFTLMVQEGRRRELFPNAMIVLARVRPGEAHPDLLVVEHHNWLLALWTGWLLLRGHLKRSRWVHHFQAPTLHFTTTSLEFTSADREPLGNRFVDLTISRGHYPFLLGPGGDQDQ